MAWYEVQSGELRVYCVHTTNNRRFAWQTAQNFVRLFPDRGVIVRCDGVEVWKKGAVQLKLF